jgi:hypothetical protein
MGGALAVSYYDKGVKNHWFREFKRKTSNKLVFFIVVQDEENELEHT